MIIVKIIILFLIFISSSSVGILLAKGYDKRVEELKEFRNALNMLKTKKELIMNYLKWIKEINILKV